MDDDLGLFLRKKLIQFSDLSFINKDSDTGVL